MKTRVGIFLILILILLIMTSGFNILAAETEAGETVKIIGTFSAFDRDTSWEYDFSDDYFLLPSDAYHNQLARVSLGLALSAFRDTGNKQAQGDYLTAFLQDAGFEDIDTHTYESETTSDSISLGIARRKAGDVTVIALAVCGGNYGYEWANNLTIGDDTLAEGFAGSAQKVIEQLDAYLEAHPIDGDAKLWITGYSRGGGVANIAAAQCTDSGMFKDVYAYTFATPRTTRESGDYRNIFNIIRKDDPVPKIPLADWGYQRYGVDMMLVSPETDIGCDETVKRTAEIYQEIIGSEMVLNGEVNYQLRSFMDYFLYVFPDSETYARLLQPLLVNIITGSDETGSALEILADALSGFVAEDKAQEAELKELQDYLETLINIYVLQDTTKMLPSIMWDQDFGIKNLVSEHFPFKYLANMFASDDPDELFSENTAYVRLVIYGNVQAQIYDGDILIKTAPQEGTEDDFSYPYVDYQENKIVISMAADRSYCVNVTSKSALPQVLAYTGNLYSGDTVRAKTDPFYYCLLRNGDTVRIVTSGNGKVIEPEQSDFTGSSTILSDTYSPTVAISVENNKIVHVTVSGLLTFLLYMLAFLLVQVIASIVLAVIRKTKKAERCIAFTAVWHGVNVLAFAFCELGAWYFVSAYPVLKLFPMILVLLVLLLLAWKLYRNDKSPKLFRRLLVYAGCLAAFGLLNGFFAGRISEIKSVILIIIYIVFYAAALLMFRKRQDS